MKPSLFIGSSVEAKGPAEIVARQFRTLCDVRPWYKDVFRPMQMVLDSLLEAAENCHFGIFLFTADDLATIRESTALVVRDNVVFESGIFFGRLGRHRSFVLVPRDMQMHMPSDFAGVNLTYYDGGCAGLPEACRTVKEEIKRQLHRDKPVRLEGEWLETWMVQDATVFGKENPGTAVVLHIGNQFLARCADHIEPIVLNGVVDPGFITGTWRSETEHGHYGAFQLRIDTKRNQLRGRSVGYRHNDNEVGEGSWIWERGASSRITSATEPAAQR